MPLARLAVQVETRLADYAPTRSLESVDVMEEVFRRGRAAEPEQDRTQLEASMKTGSKVQR